MTGGFRLGQVISGGLLALAHGTNDAQKTMGVITLALVAHGTLAGRRLHVPAWVVVSAATAIALGTYVGGWRIIRTMGSRIHKMDSAQGFAAQGAGAAVILASTHVRLPALDHAHDLRRRDRRGRGQAAVGRALGRGRQHRRRLGRSRCPPRRPIGALTYGVTRLFGTGAAGPVRGVGADPGRLGGAVLRRAQQRTAASAPAEA